MARPNNHIETSRPISYAQLPPPTEEDRRAFISRLTRLYEDLNAAAKAERRETLLKWTDWAP